MSRDRAEPKPRDNYLSLRLPEATHEQLREIAEREERSVSAQVRLFIFDGLRRAEAREAA